ncbi:MAG: histidine triad nucleotide-binding protein [Ignavibacteria bacterium]|nr:histidine triad nucleotide-binding protein [Ignavibacteria bacterium]
MKECIFCKIIQHDIPSTVVFENDNLIGFNDINPVAPHHVLFVPKNHIEKMDDLTPINHSIIGELVFHAKEYAKKLNLIENGYRLVFNNGKDAGQAVFHIHLHLIGGRVMAWPPG